MSEHPAAVKDLLHAKVSYIGELPAEPFGNRLWIVRFEHINGIFIFSVLVARPEKKLVHRNTRRLKINQRMIGDARLRFRQIKRKLAGDSVMGADDKNRM